MSQREVDQQEIDWSYQVLERLAMGFDKVTAKPGLKPKFAYKVIENLPDILDAFVNLVEEEHQRVVVRVVRAAVRSFRR